MTKPLDERPGPAELGELALVISAVIEGAVVGLWLAFLPSLALRVGGFPAAPVFFVRWAGALHLTLAAGYALEWSRFRRVTLLVLAKAITTVFLVVIWGSDGLPVLMMLATFLEGTMACLGQILRGPAEQSRHARARLRLVTPAPTEVRPARFR